MFQRLFKPRSIPRPVVIVLPFLVALIVTVITQYAVFIPAKSSSAMPWLAALGLIFGVPLAIKFRAHKLRGIGLGAAIMTGFLLVPYFAFFFGQIHIFIQDDAMPAHMKVVEVRTTISRITWIEKNAGETTVFQGPVTLHLHPGEQRVHLGTMNIPAGTYIGGVVYIGGVEVDIETDLALAGVPPDAYEEEYQDMQRRFGDNATNWSREGAIVKHTWNPGPLKGITVIYDLPPGISMPTIEVHV